MLITNREFVSRVVNNLKALNKDDHISRRFILHTGKVKSAFLMSQKLDEMTLFREDGILSNIKCFPMENVKSIDCCVAEFKYCRSVMQSVSKIPDGIFGKNGAGIVMVTTIDGSQKLDYISPRAYIDLKKRKYVINKNNYYTIADGRLILPDSEFEMLNISMFTLNKWEIDEVSDCSDEATVCKSRWDYEFVCPDRFLDLVAKDTLQEIASIYRTSIADENPNMDENQKTQTEA
jgi:hypothetical protein